MPTSATRRGLGSRLKAQLAVLIPQLLHEVDGLGEVDRQIVMGRAVDEKTYPEIGREVGMSGEATRKRFDRIWARIAPRVHGWLGNAKTDKVRPERG